MAGDRHRLRNSRAELRQGNTHVPLLIRDVQTTTLDVQAGSVEHKSRDYLRRYFLFTPDQMAAPQDTIVPQGVEQCQTA